MECAVFAQLDSLGTAIIVRVQRQRRWGLARRAASHRRFTIVVFKKLPALAQIRDCPLELRPR